MPGLTGLLSRIFGSEIPATVPDDPSPPTVSDPVNRAVGMVGRGRYRLGKGGRDPRALSPFDGGECDCSGFASWCLGLDRFQPGRIDGDWIATTSIHRDATGPKRMFRAVPIEEARAGDLVVYPSRYRAGMRVSIGHVGVVVERTGDGWDGLRVIDCAGRKGAAVAYRAGTLWGAKGGIVARRV